MKIHKRSASIYVFVLSNMSVRISLKNGHYVPLLSAAVYSVTDNAFLASAIGLKICSLNYFVWYYPTMDFRFADKRANLLKQFVRFTDTGHLVNLLYFSAKYNGIDPMSEDRFDVWPIAFNVHFAITFGYWIARLAFGMKEEDVNDPEYDLWFDDVWTALIHGAPIGFLLKDRFKEMYLGEGCPYHDTSIQAMISVMWLYVWFLCVYFPWRLRTHDPVYSVLDAKKTHFAVIIGAGCMMQGLILAGNYVQGGLV